MGTPMSLLYGFLWITSRARIEQHDIYGLRMKHNSFHQKIFPTSFFISLLSREMENLVLSLILFFYPELFRKEDLKLSRLYLFFCRRAKY